MACTPSSWLWGCSALSCVSLLEGVRVLQVVDREESVALVFTLSGSVPIPLEVREAEPVFRLLGVLDVGENCLFDRVVPKSRGDHVWVRWEVSADRPPLTDPITQSSLLDENSAVRRHRCQNPSSAYSVMPRLPAALSGTSAYLSSSSSSSMVTKMLCKYAVTP